MASESVENNKQKVKSIKIRVAKEFSARDVSDPLSLRVTVSLFSQTIVDVPGDAQAIEAVQWSTAGVVDKDTITALRIDNGTILSMTPLQSVSLCRYDDVQSDRGL